MTNFNPEFKQKIELCDANKESLELLYQAIRKAGCGYFIRWVELTTDWITKSSEDARKLHKIFEQGFIHKTRQQYHFTNNYQSTGSDGTSYYADQKQHSIIPVLYSDKPTKHKNQPCAHFEYKLTDAKTCKRKGFRIIQDLLDQDILDFMARQVTFAKKPSKKDVGEVVPHLTDRSICSRRAYEKRCDTFLESKGKDYDSISLQELLSYLPELSKKIGGKNIAYHKAMVKAFMNKKYPPFT